MLTGAVMSLVSEPLLAVAGGDDIVEKCDACWIHRQVLGQETRTPGHPASHQEFVLRGCLTGIVPPHSKKLVCYISSAARKSLALQLFREIGDVSVDFHQETEGSRAEKDSQVEAKACPCLVAIFRWVQRGLQRTVGKTPGNGS